MESNIKTPEGDHKSSNPQYLKKNSIETAQDHKKSIYSDFGYSDDFISSPQSIIHHEDIQDLQLRLRFSVV